jgi:hypothetical protein
MASQPGAVHERDRNSAMRALGHAKPCGLGPVSTELGCTVPLDWA